MNSRSIMAIAAHPGDAMFTMGAIVARHIRDGAEGMFVSLSLGERGSPTVPPDDYGSQQRAAMEEAAKLLGAGARFMSYRDAEIPYCEQASVALADIIRERRPDIIVTHWRGSWHKDHRNTHMLVRDAVFYAELHATNSVQNVFYAENWEDAEDFRVDATLDITPVYEQWIEACALFPMWRGETGLMRYNDYYQSLAVMHGCLAGCKYAVGLMAPAEQRVRRL